MSSQGQLLFVCFIVAATLLQHRSNLTTASSRLRARGSVQSAPISIAMVIRMSWSAPMEPSKSTSRPVTAAASARHRADRCRTIRTTSSPSMSTTMAARYRGAALKARNAVQVLINNGDGTFHTGTPSSCVSGRRLISAGDVNNDGKVDLVIEDW